MKKDYTYTIEGINGDNARFKMGGLLNCEFPDSFDLANRDCIRKLQSNHQLVCPIDVTKVIIKQINGSQVKQ